MATKAFTINGTDGGPVSMTSTELETLDSRIAGSLLIAGDDAWEEATLIWNAMVAKKPALVVQPTSANDVAEVVHFARHHGLLVSIKGGGHNIAGTAIAEAGLMLDMSRMRDVTVDAESRLAQVGAGCLIQHVDRATQEHGLATPLGFVSETGVAGLTLGGGFGYLARRFGWTVDNLEEVEIVTADGSVRTANRDVHPNLFWAIRGGSGNFGVVTRFTFQLHEVGPRITGGLIIWDGDRADDVLSTYRELTETAPRELAAFAMLRLAPPAPFIPEAWVGRRVAGMLLCHTGRNPARDLEPLRALGEPIADLVAEKSYVDQQSMIDDMEPKGFHQYWKAEFLPGLSTEYLDTFRDHASRSLHPLSFSVIAHLEGALNERAEDDGAVGNRDARYISGFSGTWPPDVPDDDHVAWVRAAWEAIRPFSTGGNYVNFQLAEDDEERTAGAYRNNYARLQRTKAEYDPDNLFRVNRNISPSS